MNGLTRSLDRTRAGRVSFQFQRRWPPASVSSGVRIEDMSTPSDTVTCYRPTGPDELALVRESGFRRWPPRLPEQPIFYPACHEEYAIQIARDWNAPQSGVGYVTRFRVQRQFMDRYPVQIVGASSHTEWWIPAEDLAALNDNIVGLIELIAEFPKDCEPGARPNDDSAIAPSS